MSGRRPTTPRLFAGTRPGKVRNRLSHRPLSPSAPLLMRFDNSRLANRRVRRNVDFKPAATTIQPTRDLDDTTHPRSSLFDDREPQTRRTAPADPSTTSARWRSRIPRSKTDQEGAGETVALPRVPDSPYCPVGALQFAQVVVDRPVS